MMNVTKALSNVNTGFMKTKTAGIVGLDTGNGIRYWNRTSTEPRSTNKRLYQKNLLSNYIEIFKQNSMFYLLIMLSNKSAETEELFNYSSIIS